MEEVMENLIEGKDFFIKEGILTFREGITYIPEHRFYRWDSFYKAIFPKSLKYIGVEAFSCTPLNEIVFNMDFYVLM